jgi:protein CpxP
MSKIKLLSIAVIGLLIINIAMLAFLLFRRPINDKPGGPFPEHEGPKKIIIEKLHFNPEQVSNYEMLIKGHRSAVKKLEEDIRSSKKNLYLTLNTELPRTEDSLVVVLGALQEQIEMVHYNHFKDIKKLCKPNQLVYFRSLTKELAQFFSRQNPPLPPKD